MSNEKSVTQFIFNSRQQSVEYITDVQKLLIHSFFQVKKKKVTATVT